MDEKLITDLLNQGEGSTLDYKRSPYIVNRADAERGGRSFDTTYFEEKKSELLKDILAMANAERKTDSYILIGVQERRGEPAEVVGVQITEMHDEASIQQFIAGHVEKPLMLEYRAIPYRGKTIIALRIPLNQSSRKPFLSKNDYGIVRKGATYFRLGSHTEVAGAEALRAIFAEEDGGSPIVPPQVSLLDSAREATQHLHAAFPHTTIPILAKISDFQDERGWLRRTFGRPVNLNYWRDVAAQVEMTQNSAWVYLEISNCSNIHLTRCTVQIDVTTTLGTPVPAHNHMPTSPERYGDRTAWLSDHQTFARSQATPPIDRRRKELTSGDLRPGDKSRLSDGLLLYFGEHQTLKIRYRVLARELRRPAEGVLVITVDGGKDEWSFDRISALIPTECAELRPRGFAP